ncbi:DUF6801 domain-containing protein [Streptomyces monticola]|uniref:DUF6801 domain-containing protein n=1 Tax=Streptomyces monticola TaxID=2666263 RepID=A0ABW2JCA3_9ACTN
MSRGRTRRRKAQVAAAGALALLVGLMGGSGALAGGEQARATAAYDCRRGDGESHGAEVTVTGDFPSAGEPGKPIEAEGVTVRVAPADDGPLTGGDGGVRADGSTASLTVRVAQNGRSADADWAGLTARDAAPGGPSTSPGGPSGGAPAAPGGTPAPAEEPLTFAGAVDPVTVDAAGEVTYALGRLTLSLRTVDEAAATTLSCEPRDEVRLAAVPVAGTPDAQDPATDPAPGQPENAPPDVTPEDGVPNAAPQARAPGPSCPATVPPGELDKKRLPPLPPDPVITDGGRGNPACVVAVGYSTVRKLGNSMIVNDPRKRPGPMYLAIGKRTVTSKTTDYYEFDNVGKIGFPDAESTFLTFGFQPTTAKIRFEARPVTIASWRKNNKPGTRAGYYMHLRMYDVRVGGQPLDVGRECRTARPVDVQLEGDYEVLTGGVLKGHIDIPPFSGCGVGEDLDPLLTASVSGPDNYIEINQGPICTAPCKPDVPALPK